ncbi:galactonate dehydratase [Pedococcus sp.]|jgi:galactonate dehydratase|uniref:galactonate dehydratase n=1 Tax=Pedococcus sp. TaxID=2860345 RepID=UPI002E10B74C|nr:galactonate dehydratase [Pedococcus sp.]
MRITKVETFQVAPRWLFCKVSTDEGISGWGEPVVEGRATVVRTAVHELAQFLVGENPLRIEDHWQLMTKGGFYRGGPEMSSAVSGLDQALWDIAGKVREAPVHELLGGPVRDRLRVYGWVGGDSPEEVADQIEAQVHAGLTAVKMNLCGPMAPIATAAETRAAVRRAEVAREVLGPDRDFALDFHGRVSKANVRRLLPLLEPAAPLFVEEVLVPELDHVLGELVALSRIPVATGERLFSRAQFLPVLQAGVSVVQPDLSHAGGISEVRRIAALAETYGASLAPHCPLGPIALAACVQVDFATPNVLIQEQSLGIHYNDGADLLDYLVDPAVFTIVDGHLERPTAPGLGIAVDENAVRRADEIGHSWRSPTWRLADGTWAEW